MKSVILLLAVLSTSGVAHAQYYNLSRDSGDSRQAQVVTDNCGNVHVVWVDNTTGRSEIYYSVYGSQTPERGVVRLGSISGTSDSCDYPRMAIDSAGTYVYVTWEDYLSNSKSTIVAVRFRNPLISMNGVADEYMLSAGLDSSCHRPDIGIANGVPFVCFASDNGSDGRPFNGKLYFARFDTSGNQWSSPIMVDDSVAMNSFGHGSFWGRVSPAFNGTVFYENTHGMNAFKNLTMIGPLDNRVVSGGWLPYMQEMEVASGKTSEGDRAYVLYHGDGTTCNCDEGIIYCVFDGNAWSNQTVIAGSSFETISWGGFSLVALSDTDIVAVYEKDQWTGSETTDTLIVSRFDGTDWIGSTLLPQSGGLSDPSISSGSDGNLWFVFSAPSTNTEGDVFLYGSPLTSIHKAPGTVQPANFYLSQNYPNPFNPTTQIDYSVGKRGMVILAIYNVLGERVATIVSGVKPPGNYAATFDAAMFASGVYLYRLQEGSYSVTKKMVLLK